VTERRLQIALLIFGCATACSRATPPTIQSVNAPAQLAANPDGTYSLYLIVGYDKGDSAPTTLRYRYPALHVDANYPLQAIPPNNLALGVPLSIPAAAAKGSFEYDLSLVSSSGESAVVTESVLLE
jgi:hypothetical protein